MWQLGPEGAGRFLGVGMLPTLWSAVDWLELTGLEWSPSHDLRVPGGNKGDWTTHITLQPAPQPCWFPGAARAGPHCPGPLQVSDCIVFATVPSAKEVRSQAQSQQGRALGNSVDAGSSLGPLQQQTHHDGWFKKWCWKDWIICGESSLDSCVEKWKCYLLGHVWLFAAPCTIAHQASLSMEFSRQEYWSRLPFPSPGCLPDPGVEPGSPGFQACSLPSEPPGKPRFLYCNRTNSRYIKN